MSLDRLAKNYSIFLKLALLITGLTHVVTGLLSFDSAIMYLNPQRYHGTSWAIVVPGVCLTVAGVVMLLLLLKFERVEKT